MLSGILGLTEQLGGKSLENGMKRTKRQFDDFKKNIRVLFVVGLFSFYFFKIIHYMER